MKKSATSFRLPQTLLDQVNYLIQIGTYRNKAHFIEEAVKMRLAAHWELMQEWEKTH